MTSSDTKRATLKTVAEMTGLSLSTVSLSLRDGSNVKPATRKKVAEAAQQVGYIPNRAGVRLRTGRTNVLALVLSTESDSIDFTRDLIEGVGVGLRGTRYHLNVVPDMDRSDPMSPVRYILENRVADGVILTHTSARDARVRYLLDADFPFVCYGRTEFHSPHAYHDFRIEQFVELAIQRLVQRGRKKVMLVAVDKHTNNYTTIISSFRRSVAQATMDGLTNPEAAELGGPAKAREFGRRLFDKNPDCDAIICNSELTALALVSGIQDSGRVLGQDYDLICKQTTEILPTLYPRIDTISEDHSAAGCELTKLLINRINGTDINELQSLQEPQPHWRSTGP